MDPGQEGQVLERGRVLVQENGGTCAAAVLAVSVLAMVFESTAAGALVPAV